MLMDSMMAMMTVMPKNEYKYKEEENMIRINGRKVSCSSPSLYSTYGRFNT
jgi:hypothetical protein